MLMDTNQILQLLRGVRQKQMSVEEVRLRFENEETTSYGDSIFTWLSDFEESHRVFFDTVGLFSAKNSLFVDLGAGTGRVSRMLLNDFGECHVTLVDSSANMLQEAVRNLEDFPERYDIKHGDFFDRSIDFPEASIDCIVSTFAVCHGRNLEDYLHLYEKLYRWLKPGGSFICFDHVRGDSEQLTLLNILTWQRHLMQHRPPEKVKEVISYIYKEDTPLSLSQHLQLLSFVNFQDVDVIWKKDIFAIYVACKSPHILIDEVPTLTLSP